MSIEFATRANQFVFRGLQLKKMVRLMLFNDFSFAMALLQAFVQRILTYNSNFNRNFLKLQRFNKKINKFVKKKKRLHQLGVFAKRKE
ncbi:hypothetical protein PUN28_011445 [Cardiocondyla obscurior]|uniref:Uncharacterized protein n=1 Tax=Cardiocondyla obscurior TaxID=286306 RepID=A0AAW2FDW3_9HYME